MSVQQLKEDWEKLQRWCIEIGVLSDTNLLFDSKAEDLQHFVTVTSSRNQNLRTPRLDYFYPNQVSNIVQSGADMRGDERTEWTCNFNAGELSGILRKIRRVLRF